MTVNMNDVRRLTMQEAADGTARYRALVDDYEAKKTAEGSPRSISEVYIYEGFWIQAYGAKYVVFPEGFSEKVS